MSRVLKKFQLTDGAERKLFTDKLRKEIDNLENWFVRMANKVNFYYFNRLSFYIL